MGISTSDMDLVALHQLAAATARAETAELRLADMEREVGAARVSGSRKGNRMGKEGDGGDE